MADRLRALSGFEGQDVRTFIDGQAEARGDAPWMIWAPFQGPAKRWTYAEFRTALSRFAAGLQARGVQPGQRVLIHLTNSPESVIAWLGCAYAGVVAVTTNANSTREELAYFAAHSRAVAGVTQPQFASLVRAAAPQLDWLAVTETDSGAPAQTSPLPDTLTFSAIDAEPAGLARRSHDPMAPFAIQYTSGTTARPKAVLWTHANALWGARVSALHEGLRPDDVHLVHLPLFHTNAQVYSVLASWQAGGSVVIQPRFSARWFWPASVEHRCTVTSLVPFCARAIAEQPIPRQHGYRLWCNAYADPQLEALYGVKTIGWWGMTETVTHGIVGSTATANAAFSMGRPSPAYDVLVLDDEGAPVGPGQVGNLFVRGRRGVSLFQEYADNPEATAAAFPEPDLLATGDRVRLDEAGFLHFSDRDKDMLKVGGENVAASEVERVIGQVEGVAEVAIVGRPDPMLDEVPVAFIIAREPGEALRARIQAACVESLAPFKRPRELRFVPDLPRSTLEKVAKAELRSRLREDA